MQKLSGLKGLEGFRSLAGSTSMAMKAANPKPSSDAGGNTYGSFANLKIAAEKLVKEQAEFSRRFGRRSIACEGFVAKMQKLSGLRGLEGFRSLAGSTSMAMNAANPKPSSDARGNTYGSFANLNITAEKLVKEQASVKIDLEMAHTKLRRATEQINLFEGKFRQAVNEIAKLKHTKPRRATEQIKLLEGKFQQAVNENAKLKVKQTEDSKLWQGLDSKVSSTKTLCDQLTEQQLAIQTERAEEDKELFEEKLGKNSTALDEFNCLLRDLSAKLECAEQTIISGKQPMLQIKHEKEEMDQSYKEHVCVQRRNWFNGREIGSISVEMVRTCSMEASRGAGA